MFNKEKKVNNSIFRFFINLKARDLGSKINNNSEEKF